MEFRVCRDRGAGIRGEGLTPPTPPLACGTAVATAMADIAARAPPCALAPVRAGWPWFPRL